MPRNAHPPPARVALERRQPKEIVERLKTLIQPKLSADDVTLVVVRRG
jgi:hypothetical protein